MTDEQREQLAMELGRDAGHDAATWAFDGNTSDSTYKKVLDMFDDGDPELYDHFHGPNLSGQWADDFNLVGLAEALGLDDSEDVSYYADLWEESASQAYWDEIIRVCKYQLS